MPTGLQVFNASGVQIMEVTDRLQRVIGEATIGPSAGSISVAELSSGTPFYFLIENGGLNTDYESFPNVSISGTTISWNSASRSCYMIYGVY